MMRNNAGVGLFYAYFSLFSAFSMLISCVFVYSHVPLWALCAIWVEMTWQPVAGVCLIARPACSLDWFCKLIARWLPKVSPGASNAGCFTLLVFGVGCQRKSAGLTRGLPLLWRDWPDFSGACGLINWKFNHVDLLISGRKDPGLCFVDDLLT